MRIAKVHIRFGAWPVVAWLGVFLALAAAAAASPFSQDQNGTTALDFLKFPMGPRSVGMARKREHGTPQSRTGGSLVPEGIA